MTSLVDSSVRLLELGGGRELEVWLERQGFDVASVLFTARCAAVDAIRLRESGLDPQPAITAFVSGFCFGVSLFEGETRSRRDTTDALAGALAAVAARGRQAVIADHCDLTEVAVAETAVAHAVTGDPYGDAAGIVLLLFEFGLATGLALAA